MGTVSVNGEMLSRGSILFVPAGGTTGPKVTAEILDGIFIIPASQGPVVGTHRVEIRSTETGGYDLHDENTLAQLQQVEGQVTPVLEIPVQFNRRSQLIRNVAAGSTNLYEFDLKF